jgi:hypothetical protein
MTCARFVIGWRSNVSLDAMTSGSARPTRANFGVRGVVTYSAHGQGSAGDSKISSFAYASNSTTLVGYPFRRSLCEDCTYRHI